MLGRWPSDSYMLNTYSTYTNDVRKETYYTYSIFACWPVAMEYSCEYTFTPTTHDRPYETPSTHRARAPHPHRDAHTPHRPPSLTLILTLTLTQM